MLSQIVRPMVRTQIRLLANSQATRTTLVHTITQWLGFLGVQARVTQVKAGSDQIHLSLTVGKPESCDTSDWQQILDKLSDRAAAAGQREDHLPTLTESQTRQLQRLMAHVIQSGQPGQSIHWDNLESPLATLGFSAEMIGGIRSAAKVPQSLQLILEHLDPDVAAIALPKAVSLALLDRQVNPDEDQALKALLNAMKSTPSNAESIEAMF